MVGHGWVAVMAGGMIAGAMMGCGRQAEDANAPLPEGNNGIAAKYAGDEGIEKDGAVVFANGFEGFSEESLGGWDRAWLNDDVVKATEDPANVHGGKKALEITLLRKDWKIQDSCGTLKYLAKGEDALFMRYYVKYDKEMEPFHGGGHNGGLLEAAAPGWADSTPGVKADGRNKFGALLDTYRHDITVASPGYQELYVYYPDQKTRFGDIWFPSAITRTEATPGAEWFGEHFVPRADIIPDRDRWICYELMVKANHAGKRDGRIAFWMDGKLRGDFPDLRLRDVDALKINRVWLLFSSQNKDFRKPATMWFDDVVVAKSYIGPMVRTAPEK